MEAGLAKWVSYATVKQVKQDTTSRSDLETLIRPWILGSDADGRHGLRLPTTTTLRPHNACQVASTGVRSIQIVWPNRALEN